jgi:hypothetical protein
MGLSENTSQSRRAVLAGIAGFAVAIPTGRLRYRRARRRIRRRARVFTSVRTATRNFDLELAIATSHPAPAYAETGNDSGSVRRQQGGPFCGSVR